MPYTDDFYNLIRRKKHQFKDKDKGLYEAFREAINKDFDYEKIFRARKKPCPDKYKYQNSYRGNIL